MKAQIESIVLKNKEYLIYHRGDEIKVGRMVLWKLSANNKFFLFEDKLKSEFRVYSLEQQNKDAKSFIENDYVFKMEYSIILEQCPLLQSDGKEFFKEFKELIENGVVDVRVYDDGIVKMAYCKEREERNSMLRPRKTKPKNDKY